MPDQAAHSQAKMQTLMEVHCLQDALTFQKVSFDYYCLDFHMPPDLESHADAAI